MLEDSGAGRGGLSATVGASAMTLGGILKHLALVEDDWFGCCLLGRALAPWADVDWNADRTGNGTVPPPTARTSCADSGRRRSTSPDATSPNRDGHRGTRPAGRPSRADGRAPSLRWILVHMIEEYARHNGHADLLREAVDGETGE